MKNKKIKSLMIGALVAVFCLPSYGYSREVKAGNISATNSKKCCSTVVELLQEDEQFKVNEDCSFNVNFNNQNSLKKLNDISEINLSLDYDPEYLDLYCPSAINGKYKMKNNNVVAFFPKIMKDTADIRTFLQYSCTPLKAGDTWISIKEASYISNGQKYNLKLPECRKIKVHIDK